MPMQHIENLLRRYKGQRVNIKTCSGGIYEGDVAEITNDYVALKVSNGDDSRDTVFVIIHTIESMLPRGPAV
jgi:16S rRNA U1498 N3-methylase RsmE